MWPGSAGPVLCVAAALTWHISLPRLPGNRLWLIRGTGGGLEDSKKGEARIYLPFCSVSSSCTNGAGSPSFLSFMLDRSTEVPSSSR